MFNKMLGAIALLGLLTTSSLSLTGCGTVADPTAWYGLELQHAFKEGARGSDERMSGYATAAQRGINEGFALSAQK